MKRILFIIIVLASVICNAQVAGNFKQIRLLNNTDSVSLGSTTGIIRYDPVTGKYRFFNALTQQWLTYSTASYTFTNGLTNTSGIVRLGGTLSSNVLIGGASGNYSVYLGGSNATNILNEFTALANSYSISLGSSFTAGLTGSTSGLQFYHNGASQRTTINMNNTAGIALIAKNASNTVISQLDIKSTTGTLYTDNAVSPTGIKYAASNYVTDPLSLTTKEYVDSRSPSLTSTYVGYGSGSNTLTGESVFNYDAALNILYVPSIYSSAGVQTVITNQDGIASTGSLTVAGSTDLALSGSIILANVPTSNNSATDILARNPSTGRLEYRASSTIGSSTPAGSNTQVQFNNAGAFGADSDFTFNTGTNTLFTGNLTSASDVTTSNLIVTGLTSSFVLYTAPGGQVTSESTFAYNSTSNTLTVQNAAVTSLTSTRVPIAGTSGLLGDNTDFVFIENGNNDQLRVTASSGSFLAGNVSGINATYGAGAILVSGGSGSVTVTSGNFTIAANGNIILGTGVATNGLTETFGSGSSTHTANNGGDYIINVAAANSYFILQGLPTSNAGLPSGALWNNSGTISIQP